MVLRRILMRMLTSLMVSPLVLRKMKMTTTTTRRNLSDFGMSSMLFSLFGVLMPKGER